MFQPTLLFGALLSLADAGIYFYVGQTLRRRRVVAPEARLAWRLFIVWWSALAGTTLAGSVLSLLGAFGVTDLPLFLTVTQLNLLAICIALYGLMYYLLYLFIGNRRVLGPLTVFYITYYLLLVYFINWRVPTGVVVGRWTTTLSYQQPPTGPFFALVLIFLVIPQILSGLAYFTLYFRVQEPTQKYRILLVSWSIILWFSSALLASAAGLAQQDWWQVASRLIGLAAALTILMAYRPLPWIKRRFGIASITEEAN